MRVLVTRPAAQADEWVAQLVAARIDAVALPLICIAPAADPAAVRTAWHGLPAMDLVVFVSPNAVEQFFAVRPSPVPAWPAGLRAAAVGPGTVRALRQAGVEAGQIVAPAADAPQFDSEALWAQLREADWRGRKVLVVRGDGGREWLADTLRAQGADLTLLSAYRRSAPRLGATQQALLRCAVEGPREHLWFFSSSEAIDNLAALAGPATRWGQARALVTHPRIAARARDCGFGEVTSARPTTSAVSACIQSMPP